MRLYLVYLGVTKAFVQTLVETLLHRVPSFPRGTQFRYHHDASSFEVVFDETSVNTVEWAADWVRIVGVVPHRAVMAHEYTDAPEQVAQTMPQIAYWIQHATSTTSVDVRSFIVTQMAR